MPDPRWTTPEEIRELVDRALVCLDRAGYTINGRPTHIVGQAILEEIKVTLTANGDVTITDTVAGVCTFDYRTRGIKECYGSTARNVLLRLRELMVLDDLADV